MNDMIRFAFQRGLSGSWLEDGLGAARIKAELRKVLPNPGIFVTNIDSRTLPSKTNSVGLEKGP